MATDQLIPYTRPCQRASPVVAMPDEPRIPSTTLTTIAAAMSPAKIPTATGSARLAASDPSMSRRAV
jgi:hypothetical protein